MQVNGNSPYTPIPVAARTQVNTHLQAKVKRLMSTALSHNTQLAYRRALQSLEQYLNGQQLTDGELAAYITPLHGNGKSPATIAQVVAAVKWQLKKTHETLRLPIILNHTTNEMSKCIRKNTIR